VRSTHSQVFPVERLDDFGSQDSLELFGVGLSESETDQGRSHHRASIRRPLGGQLGVAQFLRVAFKIPLFFTLSDPALRFAGLWAESA
jgi:hypothetical protein